MTMNITKDNQWRDGKALERYMLIAPLLEGSLDPAKTSPDDGGHRIQERDLPAEPVPL